uniref:Uncharacterized protein n=1 Tax=Oryza rufipogon TaxID=4529 RepID=A0A0E0Q2W5_ORYRU
MVAALPSSPILPAQKATVAVLRWSGGGGVSAERRWRRRFGGCRRRDVPVCGGLMPRMAPAELKPTTRSGSTPRRAPVWCGPLRQASPDPKKKKGKK